MDYPDKSQTKLKRVVWFNNFYLYTLLNNLSD